MCSVLIPYTKIQVIEICKKSKIILIKLICFKKILDFNNDGKPDNITFMIKRIKVHNMNAVKDPAYRFPGNYGVEKFLELFSGKFKIKFYF